MNDIAHELLDKLREALPKATVLWEKEPQAEGLKGAVLSAELNQRKLTLQFDSREGEVEEPDCTLVEDIVDDFVNFFENSIYRKEKFTRLV